MFHAKNFEQEGQGHQKKRMAFNYKNFANG
jgi:hypothetical protein